MGRQFELNEGNYFLGRENIAIKISTFMCRNKSALGAFSRASDQFAPLQDSEGFLPRLQRSHDNEMRHWIYVISAGIGILFIVRTLVCRLDAGSFM
jgi:hypothetical protein